MWFSSEEVAERYRVPLATIRKWRHEGTGPRGVKFGKHVRYSENALLTWEREQAAKAS